MLKAKIGMLVLLVAFGMYGMACKSATSAANSAMNGATSQPTSAPASRPSMLQQGAAGAMALVKMLGGDGAAKASAKQKLLAMGASALPALISALKGGSNATKKGALDVLGSMGKKASSAAAPVKSLTTSTDPGVSKAAKDTLAKIQ